MEKSLLIVSDSVQQSLDNAPNHLWKKMIVLLIFGSLSIWSLRTIQININSDGLNALGNILKYFIWPDASADPEKRVIIKYFLTLKDYGIPFLMYETIMIAFIGTLLGGVLSIPIAFLSSKNITGKFVSNIGVVIITLIRTMPVFIWAMFFVTVKGGAFAGVLAIAVTSIGMISKLFIESIEDIDKGILEALDSTGATTLQKIRYGIIPQLTANFLSTVIYRFEINVKNATILGMVGAGGIGFTLIDAIGSFNFPLVAVCLWGIIPVVFVIEYFSTRIRTKLTTGE
ncbi:MAG: phosphonate ABC transporter, permease protein PhnE [Firmicutes bacterium]|nr:phosphonate ABC transporter, permease protein PhnE [Bacillota bacterium]